jgi:WD40 repeat protein
MKVWKPKSFHLAVAVLVSSAVIGAMALSPQEKKTRLFSGHRDWVSTVAFTPDDRGIVSGGGVNIAAGETRLWHLASAQAQELSGHTGAVEVIAFAPNGTLLATAGYDRTIRLWDLRHSYCCISTLTGHQQVIRHLAFSPDGATLISAGSDKAMVFWDVASGVERSRLTGIDVLAIAPQSGLFATREIGTRTSIAIRNLTTGDILKMFEINDCWAMCAAFSPDGQSFAIGGLDRGIAVYQLTDAKPIWSLTGHQDFLIAVAFSPDGRCLASASQDRTVKLWNLNSGQEVRSLIGHTGPVTSVAFAHDGSRLVSGSYDKSVRVWDLGSFD